MNGQMMKSKKEIIEDYIKRVNPYEKPKSIAFDLRGYASYVSANGLTASEITPEIMARFAK